MKNTLRLTIFAFSILSLATTVFGQQAKIEGYVSKINGKKPDQPVTIVVTPGGQAGTTDSKTGHFSISLPDNIGTGIAARIAVRKKGWVIYHPMFGNCTTQDRNINQELLKVIIVPQNSPFTYSPSRLSAFVDELQKLTRQQAKTVDALSIKTAKLEREREKYAFVQQYATEYGIPANKLSAALARWARIKETDDKLERARKEYWLGNLERVAELTGEAGPAAIEALKQQNQQRLAEGRKVISIYTLRAAAFSDRYNFREALKALSTIEQLFETRELLKEDLTAEWAEAKLRIGSAKRELGERVAGAEGPSLLMEALAAYQQVQTFYTREQSSSHWAWMQNNRGIALFALGKRIEGVEGDTYLDDAAAAYHGALEIFTRAQWPLEWATVQNNLGAVLLVLGKRNEGVESIKYLNEAVDRHRAILGDDIRARSPRDWAGAQNNLALALIDLSEQTVGAESVKYLKEAADALDAALKILTHAKAPQEWAAAQNNLGIVLERSAEQKEGAERLKFLNQSAAAYRAALTVRTHEQLPQDWGQTQHNLSDVLRKIGSMTESAKGLEYLKEAVAGLRAVLEVRTRANSTQQWAMTQNTLGVALRALAQRMGGKERVKYLDEAAAAHRAALEVHTRTQFPQDWARAQANLAGVFFDLGLKTEGEQGFKYLNEAATKYRAALDVLTRVQSPQSWAFQQEYLGLLLGVLGERAEGAERIKYWNEAVVALRAALEIFTRSQFPQHWAGVQKYLASIYVLLEDWPRASEAIELVLQVFPNDEEMNDLGAVVYHDELFNFERSFALKRELVKRENDVNAQANFAESHFTTARFAEAEQRINDLLARPEVSISTKTALRALEIANLLAIQRANQVSNKLGVLIEEVTRQPAAFKVEWNFAGTRYFITHNEKLLPYRAWLERLLDAIKSEDRDSMMKALQEVQAEFKE